MGDIVRAAILLLVVSLCLIANQTLMAADAVRRSASTKAKETPPGEACDLLFFTPAGPLFLRAYIDVDNGSIEKFRRAYAKQLFQSLDRNTDGHLDGQEATKIPLLEESQASSGLLNDGWDRVDVQPTDGKVSLEELTDYVSKSMGKRFSVAAPPGRAMQQIRLFSKFDIDASGRVSRV